jgi:selenocysteine lyase/cysteine desulfurase
MSYCIIEAPLGQVFSGELLHLRGPVYFDDPEVKSVKRRVYMDNAATTFPKPLGVVEAMAHFMQNVGANPGRSKHDLSQEASLIVEGARKKLALLFNIPDPNRIAFTLNATESLNTVIYGS